MNCCGKCQLNKRLSNRDKAGDKDCERKPENKTEVTSSASFFPEYNFDCTINKVRYSDIAVLNPTDINSDLFRLTSI
ncbi:hypothetical protein BH10BAC3_BH10BAC3_18730 [soil metagenome]